MSFTLINSELLNFLSFTASIDEKYCDIILSFFSTSILVHNNLNIDEKIELAYALDFFGINFDEYAYKHDSIDVLRQQLFDYAAETTTKEIFYMIDYLIPEVKDNEFNLIFKIITQI